MEISAKSGVDAPVREIAKKGGRRPGHCVPSFSAALESHRGGFSEPGGCLRGAASVLASKYEPDEALARWMQRFVDFIATKRGLATALHSGDPAYSALPGYFNKRLLLH
jgi:hypothetical protein